MKQIKWENMVGKKWDNNEAKLMKLYVNIVMWKAFQKSYNKVTNKIRIKKSH
jgi:hypothetical protein